MEFEEYLRETHTKLFPDLADDPQAHFEAWISGLNSRDYIKYANDALERAERQRNERILEIIAA
jgi:hypothetical protein